ncbi:hect E3 ubiquitin ligase [Naegleria gruberi]|uniref:Hect E3 ubiquitin ligase n=1 Tax=Naegleria gruberi TaxID=5762 RepID=D2V435_NAEGR|nr:hect E3 ubiquitin ligase [Naegleria gruberi]EFC48309.1 hect E3 ubiquitin ligase [Naegleria gruberi]|eukprot:XP_002681053.1 hect E3 ubiquitin ligase [Naegleria gruberi strain NEG-M]
MGWGSNDEGQLGLNSFSVKVSTPMFINSYWFNDKDIKKISVASSGQHVLALTEDGYVYTWGRGAEHQLGVENNFSQAAPQLVDPKYFNNRKVVDIQCGTYHSCVIDDEGRLYTWGFNGSIFNQSALGHGKNSWLTDLSKPKQVEALKGEFVKQVAAGQYHTGVICGEQGNSESNQVFVWGKGDWGRLGLGNSNSKPLPTPLEMYEEDENGTRKTRFETIRMGTNYSALIDSHGKLYMFGRNDGQQLGIETPGNYVSGGQFDGESTPKLLSQFSDRDIKVKDVALGESITACVTVDGRGFVWGKNIHLPHEVNFGKGARVIECAAGKNHVSFVPRNRQAIFMMGGNWSHQLGVKGNFGHQEVIKLTRHLVPGKKLQMACGSNFTLALSNLEYQFDGEDDDFTDAALIDNAGNSVEL